MDKKESKRSLGKLIRYSMNASTLFTVVLFGGMVIVLLSVVLRPLAQLGAQMVAHSVMREMQAASFPAEHGIESLRELQVDTPGGQQWKKSMEHQEVVDYYIPLVDPKPGAYRGGEEMPRHIHTVDIVVEIEGRELFRSEKLDGPARTEDPMRERSWLMRYLSKPYTAPLTDAEENEIGSITTRISPPLLAVILGITAILVVLLAALAFGFNFWLAKRLSKPIIRPLLQLRERFGELADGQVERLYAEGLNLGRTYKEIEEIASEAGRIVDNTRIYTQRLQDQYEELQAQTEEIEAQRDELEAMNAELSESQRIISESRQRILQQARIVRQLLDHAGQGFMGFGADLRILSEYSKECVHLFGCEVGDRDFPKLIAMGSAEQEAFLRSLLRNIFQERNPHRREIYLPLLTQEAEIGGKIVKLEYKLIFGEGDQAGSLMAIMVVVTDMTESRKLEQAMEEERQRLEMIVKIVTHYKDFTECIREFRDFCSFGLEESLRTGRSPEAVMTELYRELHTFKGNFAIFGMSGTVNRIHREEERLAEWKKDPDLSQAELENRVREWNASEWIADDMAKLGSMLGEAMNAREVLVVEKERLIAIEDKMAALLSPSEYRMLLPEIRKLRQIPFRDLLSSYPEYATELAQRNDKAVLPFAIEGGDFHVEHETYHPFARSLAHLFRNMVDHGIETFPIRELEGKEAEGTIRCRVTQEGERIRIVAEDDGAGIDLPALRRKAVDRGIVTSEEAQAMSDDTASSLIFHAGLSTKEDITEISGRGIGMSAVYAEVEKLGGRIEVRTKPGKGTSFEISLPYREASSMETPVVPEIILPLLDRTQSYISETLGDEVRLERGFRPELTRKLLLHQVSVFIGLKGALEGMFVLTADARTAKRMFMALAMGGVNEDDVTPADLEDAIAEAGNVILGNSLEFLGRDGRYLIMEPPITVSTEKASFTYVESDIWSSTTIEGSDPCVSVRFVLKSSSYQQSIESEQEAHHG